jgi:linoleoyl-CoA desaturase
MFAPAHMPHEALFLERPVEGDFLLQQTATTLNFRAPQPLAFFLSGLEHQIEHHLFPGVAHGRYTEIAPIVEDVCRRHGYPYRVVGWGSALAAMGKVLRHPKPVTVLTP